MTRKNFTKAVLVARFKHCGGLCEGVLDSGTRCNAVLTPGKWHGDHDNPDGLTGEPTFLNCRCLCLPCHAAKTAVDVERISRAKRREAAHLGARPAPVRKIANRGFAKSEKAARRQAKPKLEMLPEIFRRMREKE